MRRAIISTVFILIISLLIQGGAYAAPAEVRSSADIRNSGEIVGDVNYCGPQGTSGAVVDLVGESFSAILGAGGIFKLRYVPEGAYTLRVNVPDQPVETQPVVVFKGQVTDVGIISLCPDNDGDGFALDVDCNDNNPSINPGATEVCDGVDNDCDGEVDGPGCTCTDADNDGFFAQAGCGTAVDCNDASNTINPGAAEQCDGIDNNCDATTDEGFDLSSDPNNCGECANVCSGVCSDGQCLPVCGNGIVEEGEQCDDGNMANGDGCQVDCTLPASCSDGTPDGGIRPCDGPDADFCVNGFQTCVNGQFGACEETVTDIVEVCNGIDDDCDGQTDEGNVCASGCGNGIVEAGEQCDGGGETATCNADCTVAVCGDGVLNATAGEECDDGNFVNGDGCQANCTISCVTDAECNDGNACTNGICDINFGCIFSPVSCNDGDQCTAGLCDPELGCQFTPVSCDDGNPCTEDSCLSPAGCVFSALPAGTPCGASATCDGTGSCVIE